MTDFCRGQPKLGQPARWASHRGNIWIISTWKQRDIDIPPSTARYEQTFPVSLRGQTQLHRICINTGSFSLAWLRSNLYQTCSSTDICIPVLPSSQAAPEPSHVEVASFFAQRMKGWHLTHGTKPAFSGFHIWLTTQIGITNVDIRQIGITQVGITQVATHTNSPTIIPPSLLYFRFPCCFSMLSLCEVVNMWGFPVW